MQISLASLEARVREHPWQTVGAALLLGAWVGLESPVPRNRLSRAVLAMIGSMTFRVAREVALHELLGRVATAARSQADVVVH